jgi:hypothetical protein
VVSVATNKYVEYWHAAARSLQEHNRSHAEIHLNVLTDQVGAVKEMAVGLRPLHVNVIEIQSAGWPEATLFRYRWIVEHESRILGDFLVHLDADSLIARDLDLYELVSGDVGRLTCVRHPGFRRPAGRALLDAYTRHPLNLAKDALRRVAIGGLGAWETRSESAAFVPRPRRHVYVAGGAWWGSRAAFLAVCRELANRVEQDVAAGVTAIWHDESHLNWYVSERPVVIRDSSFCYAAGYWNLSDLEPIIVAVDKAERTR